MKSFLKIGFISLLSLGFLAGCGGGNPPITGSTPSINGSGSGSGSSGSGSGSGGGTDTGTTTAKGVTYLPLLIFEASDEYAGDGKGNMFQGLGDSDNHLIQGYLINPVDARTLESITTAVASDYQETVDGQPIDDAESFPYLQKVIGDTVTLKTALVFDVSQSMYQINIQALVNEAKAYIAACHASSNPIIQNQQFVVWAFAKDIQELTSGFTNDTAAIDTALDDVVTRYNNPGASTTGLGYATNLNKAIVKVVGRYTDTAKSIDFNNDGDNNLEDRSTQNGITTTQMVLFSSGPDTFLEFSKQQMMDAIHSQYILKYDTAADPASNTMTKLYKPVFYYVVGDTSPGVPDNELTPEAEKTVSLTLTASNTYSFVNGLIVNQIDAISRRIDLSNVHYFRYAFLPRVGVHKAVFSSNPTGHAYSIYTDYKEADILGVGSAIVTVEITGPNGEYLSNKTASLSQVSTFKPVTRWTHDAQTYTWTPNGVTGIVNADGSYTVTGGTGTLTLSNGSAPSYKLTITN